MKIEIEVPDEVISSLLISAFDGASSYWIRSTAMHVPKRIVAGSAEDRKIRRESLPLIDGGMVFVTLKDEAYKDQGLRYNLKRLDIRHGLMTMCRDYPKQFGLALSLRGDGEVADLFLQCCLFGEVIFA